MHSLSNIDTNDLNLKTKLRVTDEPFFYIHKMVIGKPSMTLTRVDNRLHFVIFVTKFQL